jgi:hypothetical protein
LNNNQKPSIKPTASKTPIAMRERLDRSRGGLADDRADLSDPLRGVLCGSGVRDSPLEESFVASVRFASDARLSVLFGLCSAFDCSAAARRSARFFAMRSALRALRFARCSAVRFDFLPYRALLSGCALIGTAADSTSAGRWGTVATDVDAFGAGAATGFGAGAATGFGAGVATGFGAGAATGFGAGATAGFGAGVVIDDPKTTDFTASVPGFGADCDVGAGGLGARGGTGAPSGFDAGGSAAGPGAGLGAGAGFGPDMDAGFGADTGAGFAAGGGLGTTFCAGAADFATGVELGAGLGVGAGGFGAEGATADDGDTGMGAPAGFGAALGGGFGAAAGVAAVAGDF